MTFMNMMHPEDFRQLMTEIGAVIKAEWTEEVAVTPVSMPLGRRGSKFFHRQQGWVLASRQVCAAMTLAHGCDIGSHGGNKFVIELYHIHGDAVAVKDLEDVVMATNFDVAIVLGTQVGGQN